jgi:DNA-binding NarL/FixJ family response regulator
MKSRATILVADDHPVIADALATSLGRWYDVIGAVGSLELLGREILALRPDIVLLDLGFGETNALNVLGDLVLSHPDTKFVILTGFSEPVMADAALRAGAFGYVLKESAPSELRVAIDEALAGRRYLTPIVRARGAGGEIPARAPNTIALSDQQRSILGMLRQGMTNRAIADELKITTKTVDYHIGVLGRRVGVVGKAQLIRWSERFFKQE